MATKRDQINFVLDPEVREALDEVLTATQPTPTIKALLSYLILKERASLRKKGGGHDRKA